jgi:hypothetical protein
MVERAMEWLDEIKARDGTDKWLELIETLRSVTEGKVLFDTQFISVLCPENTFRSSSRRPAHALRSSSRSTTRASRLPRPARRS